MDNVNTVRANVISVGSPKFNFMVEDLKSILKEISPNTLIVEIDYEYTEDLASIIRDTIKRYTIKYSKNILICVAAYVSTKEFPEDQYYLEQYSEFLKDNNITNKKPVPINKVLKRDSKVFIDCGFININDWINYEYKVAFLYPNEIGLKVYKEIQKLILEKYEE